MAEALPLLLVVAVPFSVHAGVLNSLFGVEAATISADVSARDYVASEVKLLNAGNTPDPVTALGGGDIIVDEGALVSSGQSGEDLIADAYQSGEISVYVVDEGDTLSQIAEMFDVTSNTILWANDLRSSKDIHPGDSLVILPIIGVRHIVKDGDTINSIAKKYEGDAEEILSYNQLAAADDLTVGATLVIPGGNMHQAAPARSSATRVSGGASSNFTNPLPGAVRTQGIHGYNAVDLAMAGNSYGAPVRAAGSGEVIISRSSGWNGGYGQYIVIKHANGAQTLYSHLSRNDVGVGAYVAAGEVIGAVGNSGKSTGAHLHFEVRGAINPF